MKTALALLVLITSSFCGVTRLYVKSEGIENKMEIIGNDTILSHPQLMIVAFYVNNYMGKTFMLIPEQVIAGTKAEFYGEITAQCDLFEKAFHDGICLVYHRDIPKEPIYIFTFQDTVSKAISPVVKCDQAHDCEIRFAH